MSDITDYFNTKQLKRKFTHKKLLPDYHTASRCHRAQSTTIQLMRYTRFKLSAQSLCQINNRRDKHRIQFSTGGTAGLKCPLYSLNSPLRWCWMVINNIPVSFLRRTSNPKNQTHLTWSDIKQRREANPHIWGGGTNKRLKPRLKMSFKD